MSQSKLILPVKQGLYIMAPWAEYILHGHEIAGEFNKKSHEMRTNGTKKRGWFGVIRSKSNALYGVIEITDTLGPFTAEEIIANRRFNHEDPEQVREMFRLRAAWEKEAEDYLAGEPDEEKLKALKKNKPLLYNHAWVIGQSAAFTQPIPVMPKSGAVTFLNFDDYEDKKTGEPKQILTDNNKERLIVECSKLGIIP